MNTPLVFFGKRMHLLFAAVLSIPVWLVSNIYISRLPVPEDEAVSTGITICFFAGVFAGRYLAEAWKFYTVMRPQRLIAVLSLLVICCFCWLFIHADHPGEEHFTNLLLYLLPFMALSLAAGILVKTIRTVAEAKLSEARTSAAHSESELKLLQSQLSPHFLFNTLNNLYGLSLTQHEQIPPLLLRLSDLLRYTVYGSKELWVPLKEETDYIAHYIEFEKIRLGDRLSLKTAIELPEQSVYKIAPMLLIVFVENAFKHSKNTEEDKVYIDISLKTWGDRILFSVTNSYSRQEQRFNRHSGFGLDNIRKRLELLYPGAYQLDIEEDGRTYTVMLQLKNNKQP